MDEKLRNTAASAAALAASTAGVPGAAAITTAFGLYAFLARQAAEGRARAAVEGLLAEVAALGGYDAAEAESRFVALLADCDGAHEDLIYDMHRAVCLGRSRAAWPYVFRLAADRIVNHGGVADHFSRRLAWLLERCEDGDIAVYRQAVASSRAPVAAARSLGESGVRWCAHNELGVAVYLEPGRKLSTTSSAHILGADPDVAQALVLLGESRIARVLGEQQGVYFALGDERWRRFVEHFSV